MVIRMAYGLGINKPRTRLGRFLDVNGLSQRWLENETGLGEATLGRICNDKNYAPTEKTKVVIVRVLQNEIDPHVDIDYFW